MNEADIAELHHFYSKHLDFPDHQALLTLFAQVHIWLVLPTESCVLFLLRKFSWPTPDSLHTLTLTGALQRFHSGGRGALSRRISGVSRVRRWTFSAIWTFFHRCVITSLAPFLSVSVALMNHSCCPNVIVTYRGTSAEVRAVKDISPGMEVRPQSAHSGQRSGWKPPPHPQIKLINVLLWYKKWFNKTFTAGSWTEY